MTTEPNLQLNLYGFNLIFDEIIALHKNNKLPHKMLFSGPKGSGKSTLAYHIINYIFSFKEEFSYNLKEKLINKNNKSFILLNNKTHPNFFLVDLKSDKKNIEISQTREMIHYINKSNFNKLPKIILINNFFKRYLKKKPNIAITGLNPHSYSFEKYSEEEKIIKPAIKILQKKKN